jgi:hypothetical protein
LNQIKEYFEKTNEIMSNKILPFNNQKNLLLYKELYGLENFLSNEDDSNIISFYTFIFSSLKNYKTNTIEYNEAKKLIKKSIDKVIKLFQNKYDNRVIIELLYLGKFFFLILL